MHGYRASEKKCAVDYARQRIHLMCKELFLFSEVANKQTFSMYRRTFNHFIQVGYNDSKLTSACMSLLTARTSRKRAGVQRHQKLARCNLD